jgi:Zn-dependent peptidase ImmA (M78 family)/transcriptional regulator with XRE-family HTH domain
MLILNQELVELGPRLAAARKRGGFTQDEVALLMGQERPVISNWESGVRRPNATQLDKLAAIYRTSLDEFFGQAQRERPDFERLLFRDAGDRLDTRAKFEIQRFLGFLDAYGDFLDALGEPPGLQHRPLSIGEGFSSRDDIRRKAEQARSFFRLGGGPVGELAAMADVFGITVYFAPLGMDLKGTVSGAFIPHDRVGFSVLVNAETTPGRRQFTLAHELAHALFHGDHLYVGYFGRREAAERFANAFAAEFLVPTHSLRAAVEDLGVKKVADPEIVVHLQRYYGVSYAMMLVRLGAANLATDADVKRLREVQPVHLAEQLGYVTHPDEWGQDTNQWGLARFPRRFLRLLRRAFDEGVITLSGAASMAGVAEEEIEEFLIDRPRQENDEEFEYLSASA